MKSRISFTAAIVGASIGLVLLLFAIGGKPAAAAPQTQEGIAYPDPAEATRAAVAWLANTHQNSDGGFTSFSFGADQAPSDTGGTIDALLAIGPSGADPTALVDYLLANVDDLVAYAGQDGSTAGKTVLALSSAGEDPAGFGDNDFVLTLTGHLSPTGQYRVNTAFNQSLAILGLVAAVEPVPDLATEWLLALQATDGDLAGSWDDGFGTAGNADSTAIAAMALLASDQSGSEEAIISAIDFLGRTQLPSGGWEYGPGFGENANSSALVLQALVVAGEDLSSAESPWLQGDLSPQEALLSWQGESGAFQADFGDGRFDDFFSTVQSVPALGLVPPAKADPTPIPTATDEPAAAPEPTAIPTETPLPPTAEPTVAPEPTVIEVEAPVEVDPAPESVEESTPETEAGEDDNNTWFIMVIGIALIALVIAVIFYFLRNRS